MLGCEINSGKVYKAIGYEIKPGKVYKGRL